MGTQCHTNVAQNAMKHLWPLFNINSLVPLDKQGDLITLWYEQLNCFVFLRLVAENGFAKV